MKKLTIFDRVLTLTLATTILTSCGLKETKAETMEIAPVVTYEQFREITEEKEIEANEELDQIEIIDKAINLCEEEDEEPEYNPIVRATSNVNIRVSSNLESDTLGVLSEGCKLYKIGEVDGFYMVYYNGNIAYVSKDFVREETEPIYKSDITKLVYINNDTPIFNEQGETLGTLPQYEVCEVYGEEGNTYKVKTIDFSGNVLKSDCIDLPTEVIVVDLSEQVLNYYKDNTNVRTISVITGKKGHETSVGVFPIYAMQRNQTLRGENYASYVSFKIAFDGERKIYIHDSDYHVDPNGFKHGWRPLDDFDKTAEEKHQIGSHGCVNTKYEDAEYLYENTSVGVPVIVKH